MIKTPVQFWTSIDSRKKAPNPAFEFNYRTVTKWDELTQESGSVWIFEVDDSFEVGSPLPENRPPLLFLLESENQKLLTQLINTYQPEAIYLRQQKSLITENVQKLMAQSLVRSKKRQSNRDLSHRYRELDVLAANLEKLVEERTQWIESSNREQRELIRLDRRFVQFLVEMGLQRSQEDVFDIFVREFRHLRLADQVFLLRQGAQEAEITSFSSSGISRHIWSGTWWISREIESLSENCGRQLSAKLARPVGKLVAFPLPSAVSHAPLGSWAILIERAGKGSLTESEFALTKKYVQALGLTLEKILLEDDSRLTALRWEKVFDQALDPIAIVNDQFEVLRSNSLFSDTLNGNKCFQLFAHRKTPCENCPIQQKKSETTDIKVGGKVFQVSSYQIEGDSPVFLHRYVDVTEKQRQWVRFLQNEKLSSIGQIAEVMAHEIYNPLAGILALVEILLSDKTLAPTVRSDLTEIQKAALRAQKVIVNLQDFVSEEEKLISITLDEIVEKTLPLLKMKWRSYKLEVNLNASKSKVRVQPQLISQVIYNLIQNACQAMSQGQLLRLKTFEHGEISELQVIDEGAGIPEELQASIFQPFFTTKPIGQGTGLGLSLSKQFVERFGGSLSFQSKSGVGTTFRLELPIVP